MNRAVLDQLYSEKQQRVLKRYFARRPYMLINHGAVRSGKTMVDNDIFLQELLRISRYANLQGIRHPQYILGGASVNNINRNVIRELNEHYGLGIKLNIHNEFELFGNIVCCLGTDDIGRVSGAVGMTSYGLYLNEGSTAHRDVFDELLKRCSGDKEFVPMIIIDTNPDSPEHYLYKEYISLPFEERKKNRILTFHWELDDNPFLNEQVRENIKNSTPSGVFYDRKIRGLWVTADGIVYQDFDKQIHVVNDENIPPLAKFERFFCGVDWGYEHRGAILLFGVMPAQGKEKEGDIYILRVIPRQHMLIDWWVGQAKDILEQYGYGIKFYCDDARPDNISEFRKASIWAVGANKSIAAGIECVAGKWKRRKLFLARSQSTEFLREIFTYRWNDKTGLPVKENDDIMDALRYGVYSDFRDHRNDRKGTGQNAL